MRIRTPACVVVLALALSGCGGTAKRAGGSGPEWRYGGDAGPAHWGLLDPAYALCDRGRRQSPVDLAGAQHAPVSTLRLDYRLGAFRVTDNGHTIEAESAGDGGGIVLGTTRYDLVQLHFHAPSEHTVAGRHLKMELHLVHRASDGRLAVIGVLIREGAENRALVDLLGHLPAKGDAAEVDLRADALLPPSRTSYRYLGSLTTPPCTEGVRWIVMAQPIELSRDQILAFTHRYYGTDRPTQPLNGRMLAKTP